MKTVYSDKHHLHAPAKEFLAGELVDNFEKPSRAEFVLAAIKERNLGDIIQPQDFPIDHILKIHTQDYVDFLMNGFDEWSKLYSSNAFASAFNIQHNCTRPPKTIEGKLGYYLADTSLGLTKTSWDAIKTSVDVVLTAQNLILSGEQTAFALCRPPGHHATASIGAGYCFLNNVAIAAQYALDKGAKRVVILDVDYHHGNGTQDIFYSRDDVFFLSIHGDPSIEYPFFLGYEDEVGDGKGIGFNKNYPLPFGSKWNKYSEALSNALDKIKKYNPDQIIISLGVDTYMEDPISQFKLESNDFKKMGALIREVNIPTLFVLEGGYAVKEIGINVANTLEGFLSK
jgi:acetoin utilization deacetylase AcuC-like enzyme